MLYSVQETCTRKILYKKPCHADGQVSCTGRLVQVSCTSFLTVCHHHYRLFSLMHGIIYRHAPEYLLTRCGRESIARKRKMSPKFSTRRPFRRTTITDGVWFESFLHRCTGINYLLTFASLPHNQLLNIILKHFCSASVYHTAF